MNNNITFCAVYRNESQRVRMNLDFATEMFNRKIIAVQESDDETLKICQQYPGKIIERPSESPEESRDFVMDQLETPWAFWLDADEVPSVSLIRMLEMFDPLTMGDHDAVSLVRINYVDGFTIMGGQENDRQFRLLRKDVRWKTKEQGRRIHVHPLVKNPYKSERCIFHHRTLEKVEKQTERWNELESQTRDACNKYVAEVKKELCQKKSQ